MLILLFIAIWLSNVYAVYWLDRHILFRRQVMLMKKALEEELRQIKAEKLSTPGGELE